MNDFTLIYIANVDPEYAVISFCVSLFHTKNVFICYFFIFVTCVAPLTEK